MERLAVQASVISCTAYDSLQFDLLDRGGGRDVSLAWEFVMPLYQMS